MPLSPQIEARRAYDGPALLERGFRPFFLFAGLWAIVSLGVWLGLLTGLFRADGGIDPVAWHGHELIFGYAGSAIMGFALTAIPNWTGRLPVRGMRLLALALFWLVARLVSLASLWNAGLYPVAAALEMAMLAAFALIVWREIISGGNWRNLPVAGMITLFGLAAAASHLGRLGLIDTGTTGIRAGLATLILLITLIGGRIVPSFTGNWLKAQGRAQGKAQGRAEGRAEGETRLPPPFGGLDKITIAATLLALLLWLALPRGPLTAAVTGALALLHVARMARWRGLATLTEPLVAMLHAAYAWIPVGFALAALAALGLFPVTAALHAWTVGAVGGMTLAVMTRASLGHSGRALAAGPMTVASFLALNAAALLRLLDGAASPAGVDLVMIAGVCWLAAFALYLAEYAPVQLRK